MERIFQLLAVVLFGVAAFFFWRGNNNDALFASTVFGCVALFLSIRYQAKARVDQRNAEIIEEKYGSDELEEPTTHSADELDIKDDREKLHDSK